MSAASSTSTEVSTSSDKYTQPYRVLSASNTRDKQSGSNQTRYVTRTSGTYLSKIPSSSNGHVSAQEFSPWSTPDAGPSTSLPSRQLSDAPKSKKNTSIPLASNKHASGSRVVSPRLKDSSIVSGAATNTSTINSYNSASASAKISTNIPRLGSARLPSTAKASSNLPSPSSSAIRQTTFPRPLPHPYAPEQSPTARASSSSKIGPAGVSRTVSPGKSVSVKGPRARTLSSPSSLQPASPMQPSRRHVAHTPPSSSPSPKSADIPTPRSDPAFTARKHSHEANASSGKGEEKPTQAMSATITQAPLTSAVPSVHSPVLGTTASHMVTRSKSAIVGSPVGPRPLSSKGLSTGPSQSNGIKPPLSRAASASAAYPSEARTSPAPAPISAPPSSSTTSQSNSGSRSRQLSAASSSSIPRSGGALFTASSSSLGQAPMQIPVTAKMHLSAHRGSSASEQPPMNLKRLLATPASTSSYVSGGGDPEALRKSRKMQSGNGGTASATQGSLMASSASAALGSATDGELALPEGNASRYPSDSEGYKSAPGAIGSVSSRSRVLTRSRKSTQPEKSASDVDNSVTVQQVPGPQLVRSPDGVPSTPPAPRAMKIKGFSLPSLSPKLPSTPNTPDPERSKPNVLRRRPSTGGATKSPSTPASYFLFAHPAVQSTMTLSPPDVARSRSQSREGSAGDGSASGSLSGSRRGSISASASRMTPAAQVVEAYRSQEARRDDLVARSGYGSTSTSASASVVSVLRGSVSPRSSPAPGSAGKIGVTGAEATPGTPSFTFLGSTSGRVVAVGSPADSWRHDLDAKLGKEYVQVRGRSLERDRPKNAKGEPFGHVGHSSSGGGGRISAGLGRSLSRKVSTRWKKASGAVCGAVPNGVDENVPPEEDDHKGAKEFESDDEDEAFAGRVEKGKDKSWMFAKLSKRRSLRLSIDQFADIPGAMDDAVPVPVLLGDSEHRKGSRGIEPQAKTDAGLLNGGRIWKLMKRLSNGGLRDKYCDPEEPPPVPALPKDLSKFDRRRRESLDEKVSASMPGHVPSSPFVVETPLKKHATAVAKVSGVASTGAVVSVPRLSMNTRSSSPVSSELASLRFFRSAHSPRSSTSSFEDLGESPPMPTTPPVAQHIIHPREFNRSMTGLDQALAFEGEGKARARASKVQPPRPSLKIRDLHAPAKMRSPDDWVFRSPAVELPSLPHPPRKQTRHAHHHNASANTSRSPSPAIPSFSTSEPINSFIPRKSPQSPGTSKPPSPPRTHHQTASVPSDMCSSAPMLSPPPPRPTRSAKRPATSASSRVTSPARPATAENSSRYGSDTRTPASPPAPPRASLGSRSLSSTLRPSRRSASGSPQRAAATFRELPVGVTRSPQALSEREKAEKWDALLERSARAGGTLHLGGTELLSDRLSCLSSDTAAS